MARRLVQKPAQLVLILLMAVGSIMMWIGLPLAWLYVGSKLQNGGQPTMGPYVVVIVGIPVSMVIVGRLLSRLNRMYGRLTGTTPTVRAQVPWLKSMRGERGSTRPHTVLDAVMVVSVTIALIAFGLWFFLLAGSSLPTP
jgi:hypothetical protein